MPAAKSSRAKAAEPPHVHAATARARAPFGFVFFFLLLTATFVFSTFFVISQTSREEALRNESLQDNRQTQARVNALQTQVNTLSAQVSLQQERLLRLEQPAPTSTTSSPARR